MSARRATALLFALALLIAAAPAPELPRQATARFREIFGRGVTVTSAQPREIAHFGCPECAPAMLWCGSFRLKDDPKDQSFAYTERRGSALFVRGAIARRGSAVARADKKIDTHAAIAFQLGTIEDNRSVTSEAETMLGYCEGKAP